MKSVIILMLLYFATSAEAKKILGIYSHPGRSHQSVGEIILKSLAKHGHEVTMVSAFPLKQSLPNYTDIHLDGFLEDIEDNKDMYLTIANNNDVANFNIVFDFIRFFTNKIFSHHKMQKLFKSGQKFDLIIMDWFMKDAELYYGYIFEAPIILTSSFGTQEMSNYLFNNPEPYSYVPLSGLEVADEMTFFERVFNTLGALYVQGCIYYNQIQQENILKRYFENAPSIEEMKNNIALIFSNAHPAFESPRPYLPNVIPIGGIHITEAEPLPQELQEYMDAATNGVIYFSLGSHMKSSYLPDNVIKNIVSAFSKVPQKVLWKWELDATPNISKNVLIRRWFPQNSILAHKNTKVFMTHGGLLSKIEAIYYGVPMIGIPLFGDQKTNVAHTVAEGIGLRLKFRDLSEEKFLTSLNEVVNNPKYTENIKKKSLMLRDQPMKPLDTAIYWAEYVMRYNGTSHLQNKSVKLNLFQNLLIDVVIFLFGIFVAIIFVLKLFVSSIYRLIIGNPNQSVTQNKKRD